MPIRPENRARYPQNWTALSTWVRFTRAEGRCECRGECGRPDTHLSRDDDRCLNEHGEPAAGTGKRVILTTAHRDHTPEHCDPSNMFAACQGCHLHYDRAHHAATAAATRAVRLAETMTPLFPELPARKGPAQP